MNQTNAGPALGNKRAGGGHREESRCPIKRGRTTSAREGVCRALKGEQAWLGPENCLEEAAGSERISGCVGRS